nr:reverse transcriptase [Tanacetum cinerariifolium]
MAPSTRTLASISVENTIDDSTKRYVDEALVGIKRAMMLEGGFLGVSSSFSLTPYMRTRRYAIIQRFGTVFDDPMIELKNVKYDNNAKEYQDKFDDLLNRVKKSIEHSVSLYLGGLTTELELGVRMFKPQTLADAYGLTNLQEATLNPVKKKNKMQFGASGSRLGGNGGNTNSNTKPLLPFPNTTKSWANKSNTNPPRRQLSQKEYEEKMSKNLCLTVIRNENLEAIKTEEIQPQISLNALSGVSSFQTLRMVKRLGCKIRPKCPLIVNVAREKQLLCSLQGGNLGKKHYTWTNGHLLRKNKVGVGNDAELKSNLLNYFHGSLVGDHSGLKVTTYRMCSMLYWKGMRKYIKKFVRECIVFQRYKLDLAAYLGLLQSFPVPNRIWESVSMNFIEALTRPQGYTIIFVVVDRLTTYAHFIPLSHPFTATQVAQEFIETVYKLHGLPTTIISHRDKIFLNFHTSIQTTPFEVVYGKLPPIHIPYFGGLSKVDAIDKNLEAREQTIKMLKFHLERLQNKMKQQADKKRSDKVLHVGDWVFLKLQPHMKEVLHSQILDLPRCNKEGLMEPKPIALLDKKMLKKNNAVVVYGLVQWANGSKEDATWELLEDLYAKFSMFVEHS